MLIAAIARCPTKSQKASVVTRIDSARNRPASPTLFVSGGQKPPKGSEPKVHPRSLILLARFPKSPRG